MSLATLTMDLVTQKPLFHIYEWSGTNKSDVGWITSIRTNWRKISMLAFQLCGTGTNPTGASVVQLKAYLNATQYINCGHYRWAETGVDVARNTITLANLISTYQVATAESGSYWWCQFLSGVEPADFTPMAVAGFRCLNLDLTASAATSDAFTWTTIRMFLYFGEH